jgi:hypothetical protein
MTRIKSKERIPDTLKRRLIEWFFLRRSIFFYLSVVEVLKLLEISIFLSHSLCRMPKMWRKVLLEESLEYYWGEGFFVK